MLATRQHNPQPISRSNKHERASPKPAPGLRMSNFGSPNPSQPEWQEHYSFSRPGDGLFTPGFEQTPSLLAAHGVGLQQRASGAESNDQASTLRDLLAPGDRESRAGAEVTEHGDQSETTKQQSSIVPDPEEHHGEVSGARQENSHEEPPTSSAPSRIPLFGNPAAVEVPYGSQPLAASVQREYDDVMFDREEEDIDLDDEENLEVEGEGAARPQTAAERAAARRKMKRFRLTHQQTRFLMSEFAKQPHPDAAHRERLSREIPGLSPRQVQVWFQNRRAKIKRLTADDRDRMIKSRAVPVDFDNVRALHSPYGAVPSLSAPVASPADFQPSSAQYAEHMMRPLMVDTMRRGEADGHMSPTGLTPGFGAIGFTSPGQMGSTDLAAPMSPSGNERGYYSTHLTSPVSAGGGGGRPSSVWNRQNSLDSGLHMQQAHARQQMRSLQPLQLRETMSRSRQDSIQSPLRSSMSWKGDSIDYSSFHGARQQQPLYTSEPLSSVPSSGPSSAISYDSSSYTASTVQTSPGHEGYQGLNPPILQQPPQQRSRLRAASATLPLALGSRNPYRTMSLSHGLQNTTHTSTPRAVSTTAFGDPSPYSTSYPSAPLAAPVDFMLAKTSGGRVGTHSYSMPQMSAPIAPPPDFSQALQGSLSSSDPRTPLRDGFGAVGQGGSQGHGASETLSEAGQAYPGSDYIGRS